MTEINPGSIIAGVNKVEANRAQEITPNSSQKWLSRAWEKMVHYSVFLGLTLYSINPKSGTKQVEAKNVKYNIDADHPGLHMISNGGRVRFQDASGNYYSLVDHNTYANATEETIALGMIDEIPGVWYKNIGETLPQ